MERVWKLLMDNQFIYKTLEECKNLQVSNSVYVVSCQGYSIENIFQSRYYAVKQFNSGKIFSYYSNDDIYFDESVRFDHLVKAVSRRGITAVIRDSFESDSFSGGSPNHWAEYTCQPTFRVDDVLCICTNMIDDKYLFLPLSEHIKKLKAQKDSEDNYARQCYLDGDY
jgi:hypothetical protein